LRFSRSRALTTQARSAYSHGMIAPAASAKTTGKVRRGRAVLIAGLVFCGLSLQAVADTRLNARYTISMMGVSIGQMGWATDIGETGYTSSANGKASGAFSMLVNGEGRAAARGAVQGAYLVPAFFSSNSTDDGEIAGLQMTFENGGVKTLRTDEPLRKPGRIPVSEADRQGVSDPLSAMLFGPPLGEPVLSPASCDRVLPIFDGQRRYNLALSFKRIEDVKVGQGYAGPALVCGVVLEPIAGYRVDSVLVKYVGGRRGLELWFAPIAGTDFTAPVRVSMPTLIGTLELIAERFEATTTTTPSAPAESKR
jgi:hypothetical protein